MVFAWSSAARECAGGACGAHCQPQWSKTTIQVDTQAITYQMPVLLQSYTNTFISIELTDMCCFIKAYVGK